MRKRVGVVGLGTVGGGFYDLSDGRIEFGISKVLNRSPGKYALHSVGPSKVAGSVDELIDASDIVVETVGGIEFPFEIANKALKAGKDVVTANKALIADRGVELLELAKKNGRTLLFGASVGGGMPVLSTLQYHACGKVKRIFGIMNATSNFILSGMACGKSFGDVLKEAQRDGYAEADPTDDVEGFDAARKLAIMCATVTGGLPDLREIPRTGLAFDPETAKKMEKKGMVVKPLVYMEKREGGIELWTGPAVVGKNSRVGMTDGTENCVFIEGDSGINFLSGIGAGKNPTAFAVLQDVLSIINGESSRFDFRKADFEILKSGFEEIEKVKILKFS